MQALHVAAPKVSRLQRKHTSHAQIGQLKESSKLSPQSSTGHFLDNECPIIVKDDALCEGPISMRSGNIAFEPEGPHCGSGRDMHALQSEDIKGS
jgi:hypothetical protein